MARKRWVGWMGRRRRGEEGRWETRRGWRSVRGGREGGRKRETDEES